MPRLLGLLAALAAATTLLALTAGQAAAQNVQCGDVITQDTTLDKDLICPAGPPDQDGPATAALRVDANDVTLDLAGHTIDTPGSAIGMSGTSDDCCGRLAPSELVIENGTLKRGGVRFSGGTSDLVIRHIALLDGADISLGDGAARPLIEANTFEGGSSGVGAIRGRDLYDAVIRDNRLTDAGIISFVFSENVSITGNTLVRSDGISLFKASGEIAHNTISRSPANRLCAVGIDLGGGSIHDNVIVANATAGVCGGTALVTRNLIADNGGDGVWIGPQSNPIVRANVITRNHKNGVYLQGMFGFRPSAEITGNTVTRNALDGVFVGDQSSYTPSKVATNVVDRNGDDGIDVETPDAMTTVVRNHAWWNGDLGIEAVPGTQGGRNWVKHNGNPLQCVPMTLCSTTGKPKG
jgi:hypothetical protein